MFFVSGQPNRNDNYKKTIERANHYGYPINFYRIEPCCIVFWIHKKKKKNEVEAAHGVFVCLFVFSFGQISLILYYCMFPIFFV